MKNDLLIKFGKIAQDKRLEKGLSQEKLASLYWFHRTYIKMIKRAEKNITLKNIEKIAHALQLEISSFFLK
jgi:transcriptional regulator with XRE-family HTH domain